MRLTTVSRYLTLPQMRLKATSPTRLDLAGATLDIYPLYIFEGGGLTLNAAIDLGSQVELEVRADRAIRIESEDLNLSLEAPALKDLVVDSRSGPLDLIVRVLQFYRPSCGLNVRTRSTVPPGSGLGGSSSLLITLSSALVQLENRPVTKTQIIDFGARIEAQSLGIPTGKQDYYPPAFGGFNALWFGLEGDRREPLCFSDRFRDLLETRVLLAYSGSSRFSGATNWDMLSRYIEGQPDTVSHMKEIKQTAAAMYRSLREEDWTGFVQCLGQEWENRRRLAHGLATREIEDLFKAAREAGAAASKVCGAGGGGCFITLVDPKRRPSVEAAIEDAGGRILPYRFAYSGVRVEEV